MPRVEESIPAHLVAQAEAARDWFSRDRGTGFALTGIVDPEELRAPKEAGGTRELQLILCGVQDGQDVCLRESFAVTPAGDGFEVRLLGDATPNVGSPAPPLLHVGDPVLDTSPVPWPYFVAMLFANGWFLRPVPFDQGSGKDPLQQRLRIAMLRIVLFLTAWILAAILLPTWLVALAFAGWAAYIVPGVRLVNRRFQNVGPDEEPA